MLVFIAYLEVVICFTFAIYLSFQLNIFTGTVKIILRFYRNFIIEIIGGLENKSFCARIIFTDK